MAEYDPATRSPWVGRVLWLLVAAIVATPFIAIILQALGKR